MKAGSHDLHDGLAWWREARFGMFIHWGIYAVPAGIWKGEPIPSLGEWIMRNARIPIPEYEQLAQVFNPVAFNAREWVGIAKRAGMKYLVITAKHHDGFSMFRSPCNPYNIVDATPYGHDAMADLAEACREAGLRLCFYYSQAQDWHAPGGAGHWEEPNSENWWNQPVNAEAFARYLEEKVKPQVTELLTQYGPIGLIWFDTPVAISREQSQELADLVHRLQPDCLVSGRVGHDVGDYGSLGDNEIPCGPVQGDWETPATINDTWGYKTDDHNWKSVGDLLHLLVDLASKGVNYLLNVGPTAEGLIPQPSVERLLGVGEWMDVNGEAIYGTGPNPYPYEFAWGRITTKEGRLFVLFYTWPEEFRLSGLRNHVREAYLLADPTATISMTQIHDTAADRHELRLALPATAPDPCVSVVVVEFDGALDVDTEPLQQSDGRLSLPPYLAEFHRASAESTLGLSRGKVLEGWKDAGDWLSWRFKTGAPGEFAVRVLVTPPWYVKQPPEGHAVSVTVAGQTVRGELSNNERVEGTGARLLPGYGTTIGRVTLEEAGSYELSLRAEVINPAVGEGLVVSAVELVPVGSERQ